MGSCIRCGRMRCSGKFERRRGTGNIVLKARQMGLTTWVAGRFLLKTICHPGTLTLLVAHTQGSAEEILGIVHRFVEHLPPGLTVGALKTAKSNVRQIVFPEIDSEFRVVSASDRNAGRGMTFQNLHCSEVARWDADAAEVLAGLRAGLAPGGEQVLESTPNGTDGCFYEEWQRAGEVDGGWEWDGAAFLSLVAGGWVQGDGGGRGFAKRGRVGADGAAWGGER